MLLHQIAPNSATRALETAVIYSGRGKLELGHPRGDLVSAKVDYWGNRIRRHIRFVPVSFLFCFLLAQGKLPAVK